jgi:calcineurin-like phosphoesterase family protein
MNYYIISDTHFNHRKLIVAGYRPEDFEAKILNSFNRIGSEDILIHLGDISIGKEIDFHQNTLSKFKFRKYLVRGNHDKRSVSWYLNNGWNFVCDSFSLNMFGKNLTFTHKPVTINKDEINVHGHIHSLHREKEYDGFVYGVNHVNVSPEVVGYNVISLRSLIERKF